MVRLRWFGRIFFEGQKAEDELNKKMADTKEYQTQRENLCFGDFA